jgi:hypothetical protein
MLSGFLDRHIFLASLHFHILKEFCDRLGAWSGRAVGPTRTVTCASHHAFMMDNLNYHTTALQ